MPIPEFDDADPSHHALAGLAERAESVAAAVELEGVDQFQKARRMVRHALLEDGIDRELASAVENLLTRPHSPVTTDDLSPADNDTGTPDLMGTFRTDIRRRRRARPVEPSDRQPTNAPRPYRGRD